MTIQPPFVRTVKKLRHSVATQRSLPIYLKPELPIYAGQKGEIKMKIRSLKRNKKGISPIIATLLLIVIAVAAAVVVYAFVSGFVSSTTKTTTAEGTLSIPDAAITGATNITVYVENIGTQTENITTAYVDNLQVTLNTAANGSGTTWDSVSPGTTVTLYLSSASATWNDGSAHTIKIVCPDGTTTTGSAVS